MAGTGMAELHFRSKLHHHSYASDVGTDTRAHTHTLHTHGHTLHERNTHTHTHTLLLHDTHTHTHTHIDTFNAQSLLFSESSSHTSVSIGDRLVSSCIVRMCTDISEYRHQTVIMLSSSSTLLSCVQEVQYSTVLRI